MAKKPSRRPVRRAEVGGIYSFLVPDGRCGACQLLSTRVIGGLPQAEVATLDYLAARAVVRGSHALARVSADVGELERTV
jgi:hypothetical protein